MQKFPRKIIDLRKRKSEPLIIARKSKPLLVNLLQLTKISAREAAQASTVKKFDLSLRSGKQTTGNFFLAGKSQRPYRKVRFIVGALIAMIFINLFGVFGRGKNMTENILNTAISGITELARARESFAAGKFTESSDQFAQATTSLRAAEKDLIMLSGAGIVLNQQPESVQSGSRLVSAGKMLGSAGENFAQAAETLELAGSTWLTRQKTVESGATVASFSTELALPISKILAGIGEMENAMALLKLVNTAALPSSLSEKVTDARQQLSIFLSMVQPWSAALPELPNLLGDQTPRKYLILFQNPDEIRPTGGFIGSVGVLTLNDGFVSSFEIKDVYSIDGQLRPNLQPPEGFGLITATWGLRDANYHPDFPTSAAAAGWLFEEAGFGSVDGVFAVTSNVLRDLVQAIDGVRIPRFREKISASDLNLLLSLLIETKVDGAANPKQVLSEVWEALRPELERLPAKDLFAFLLSAGKKKDLQFWSSVSELQKIAVNLDISGALQKNEGDYLYVVNTSLSGNKSDRYTANQISHATDLTADGSALDTLTLTRSHRWDDTERDKITRLAKKFGVPLDTAMLGILGDDRNIDLIKIFVPLGSELVSVVGIEKESIETKESLGKTYFVFTLTTQPGFSRAVKISYKIPQEFAENYEFVSEYQAGDQTKELEKIVRDRGEEIEHTTLLLGEKLEVKR